MFTEVLHRAAHSHRNGNTSVEETVPLESDLHNSSSFDGNAPATHSTRQELDQD